MKEIWCSTKRNNVGMSLVEVVAAIAILSIVILAVLQSFVYSARYNARSRERQQTTAAAQTVMENFKAYSVQEIYDQFVSYDPNVSGSGYHLNGGLGSYYEGVPGGHLKFEISHMQYQEELYDVCIDVFPHDSDIFPDDSEAFQAILYEPPTQEHAAVYVGEAGMDADALRGIIDEVAEKWTEHERAALGGGTPGATPDPSATSVPAISHSPAEVDSSKIEITKRELRIDIDDSTGNYVAKVSCAYTYNYPKDTHGRTDAFELLGQIYEMDLSDDNSMSKVIFNQASALECLNLYYYPAYNYVSGTPSSSEVRIKEDNIYINNSSDTNIKCYIYKQKNLAISDAILSTVENLYKVNLHLNGADVYDDNLNVMLGSDTDTIVDSKIPVSGSGTRYRGIGHAAAYVNYPTVGNASPPLPSLDTVRKKQIMYDIEIAIYESGLPHQEPLNTLKGTIID